MFLLAIGAAMTAIGVYSMYRGVNSMNKKSDDEIRANIIDAAKLPLKLL